MSPAAAPDLLATVPGVRVLLVEDEPDVADALARGLTADGFTVDVTHDGTDGLWLAQTNEYAAIVLDVMLPGTNGYEICRTLRADDDWTPILMLTAKDGEYDQAEGLDLGADDYLTKPTPYVVLLAHLRALIRRAEHRPADSTLQVGDLKLDPQTVRVWRGDDEIELSPKAFAVLEYLMSRPDHVVAKTEIVDNVWGHDFDGDPNIVEVYVSRIRSAIDGAFDRRSLETVRGLGYRLRSDGGRPVDG